MLRSEGGKGCVGCTKPFIWGRPDLAAGQAAKEAGAFRHRRGRLESATCSVPTDPFSAVPVPQQ